MFGMTVLCVLRAPPGARPPLSPSSSATSRGQPEGTSDLVVDASYYNFYQPSRYPAYYSNLYNYQQYQVNTAALLCTYITPHNTR